MVVSLPLLERRATHADVAALGRLDVRHLQHVGVSGAELHVQLRGDLFRRQVHQTVTVDAPA
jgi:hypothetical protein